MSFEYDPVTSLQHYPVPMARFGQNVWGENLYRIVLASSRRHLVGGMWPDGEVAYHWLPTYKGLSANCWVLERWQMPLTSKAAWDQMVEPISGWLINGPYPARGEYYHAWTFDKGVDSDNLDAIVGACERGKNYSFQDIADVNYREYKHQDAETHNNTYAEIRDAFTAFGGRAFSSARVARGIKTREPVVTAEGAGLPIPRTPVKQSKRITSRRTFDVRDIEVASTVSARS